MSEFLDYTSDFLKTISDTTRLQILELLKDNESGLSAKQIETQLNKVQSTISQHLKMLDEQNLLLIEKRDNVKHYKIKDPVIFKILAQIRSFVVNLQQEKLKELRDIHRRDALM